MAAEWVVEEGSYGPRMVMKGAWSTEALAAIRLRKVKELELNHAKGWKGADLSFLTELSDFLESFTIIDFTIDDIGPVNSLTSLRSLDVNTYCKTEIRFSQFPLLEECSLEWRPKASTLFDHHKIRKLFINKFPRKDLTAFSRMTTLESLSLASPRIETLQGVQTLKGLIFFLGLYVARHLMTLEGVEALTNLLHLEVNDTAKVRNILPVAALHQLRQLHLCNDGEIETVEPLGNLKHLETFLFYESTNVVDGKLDVLKKLPKLRSVAFMERPHYSHRRSDFPVLRAFG